MQLKYNTIETKSKTLAIRIVQLAQYLQEEKREFVLSGQLLRSGTNVGALVKGAIREQNKAELLAKINSALEESAQIEYLLEILHATNYLSDLEYESINDGNKEVFEQLTGVLRVSEKKQYSRVNA